MPSSSIPYNNPHPHPSNQPLTTDNRIHKHKHKHIPTLTQQLLPQLNNSNQPTHKNKHTTQKCPDSDTQAALAASQAGATAASEGVTAQVATVHRSSAAEDSRATDAQGAMPTVLSLAQALVEAEEAVTAQAAAVLLASAEDSGEWAVAGIILLGDLVDVRRRLSTSDGGR